MNRRIHQRAGSSPAWILFEGFVAAALLSGIGWLMICGGLIALAMRISEGDRTLYLRLAIIINTKGSCPLQLSRGERDEENPGYSAEVNSDDDNNNDIPDSEEIGTVTGEDDLIPLELHFTPAPAAGLVTLRIAEGSGRVKVWLSSDKAGGTPLLGGSVTEVTWDAGEQPDRVYVEAIGGSTSVGDIAFSLGFGPTSAPTTQVAADIAKQTNTGFVVLWMGPNKQVQDVQAGNVMVGQEVWLLAVPLGPGADQSTYQWTVGGGTAVENYTVDAREGEVSELTGEAVQRASVHINWLDGAFTGNNAQVSVVATVNGTSRSANTTFTVFRPDATMDQTPSPLTEIKIGDPEWPDAPPMTLHYGSGDPLQSPGNAWTATVSTPAGGTGEIAFLQLVSSSRRRVTAAGISEHNPDDGEWVLDGKLGSTLYGDPKPIAASDTQTHNSEDSPYSSLDGATWYSRFDIFHTYLMYRPTGGIWVPLREMQWTWSGTVEKNAQGDWIFDLRGAGHGLSVNTVVPPEWSGNGAEHLGEYVPEP